MNTSSDFDTRAQARPANPLQTVLTTSLAQEAHDVIRHLGRILGIKANEQVLLIPGDGALTALSLVSDYDCRVTVLMAVGDTPVVQPADERVTLKVGSLDTLPFEAGSFDAVIVAVPLTTGLQRVARELSRVLKHSGRLGMVALSPYRDQVSDDVAATILQPSGAGEIRAAASYRAVLGEAGFTAFVTQDRRRALRRSAQAIYREHILDRSLQIQRRLAC